MGRCKNSSRLYSSCADRCYFLFRARASQLLCCWEQVERHSRLCRNLDPAHFGKKLYSKVQDLARPHNESVLGSRDSGIVVHVAIQILLTSANFGQPSGWLCITTFKN